VSGKIDLIHLAVVLISLISIITDIVWGKIYNWLTIPTALVGLIYAASVHGWHGLFDSLGGVGLGLLLFGWIFYVGWMGGGDVKLLMALGALGGYRYVAEVALLSILIGGCISVGILLVRGRMLKFTLKMYDFLLSFFIKELDLFLPKLDQKLTMPFGIAIGLAAIWNMFFHPLGSFL